jgi:hypothetical protein
LNKQAPPLRECGGAFRFRRTIMTDLTSLNAKGQCPACGKKPRETRVHRRHFMLTCIRCNRAFDIISGVQIQNWGLGGSFARHL